MEALDRQLAANLAANLEAERLYKARAEADVEKVAAARAEEVREVEKVVSRVVIVGGGCAGVFTAKALKGAISKGILEVTLVTPTEYVEWHGGHIRGLAVPKEADRSFAPSVVACVKGAKVVQGKAISVTSDAIIVASRGQSEPVTVPYDLLVIATGGRYANPTTAFLKSPEVRSRCSIAAGLPHPSRLADNTPLISSASERDGVQGARRGDAGQELRPCFGENGDNRRGRGHRDRAGVRHLPLLSTD